MATRSSEGRRGEGDVVVWSADIGGIQMGARRSRYRPFRRNLIQTSIDESCRPRPSTSSNLPRSATGPATRIIRAGARCGRACRACAARPRRRPSPPSASTGCRRPRDHFVRTTPLPLLARPVPRRKRGTADNRVARAPLPPRSATILTPSAASVPRQAARPRARAAEQPPPMRRRCPRRAPEPGDRGAQRVSDGGGGPRPGAMTDEGAEPP